MAEAAEPEALPDVGAHGSSLRPCVAPATDCPSPLPHAYVDAPNWEPDGGTHPVRSSEGPGTTGVRLRSCGTAGKPGGKQRKQTST